MKEAYEGKYHQLEETHWWFEGRRALIYDLFLAKAEKGIRILDIACAGGPLLQYLNGKGFKALYGIDLSNTAIAMCRERGLTNVEVCDAADTKFRNGTFDFLIASDILEHIEDDERALIEWHRILKKGGKLVVFVPAHKYLWSHHDEQSLHKRRYSKRELLRITKKAGFKIVRVSYWNSTLFPIVFILNSVKNVLSLKSDNLARSCRPVNYALSRVIGVENWLICRGINLPFGISLMVLAEK